MRQRRFLSECVHSRHGDQSQAIGSEWLYCMYFGDSVANEKERVHAVGVSGVRCDTGHHVAKLVIRPRLLQAPHSLFSNPYTGRTYCAF